MTFKGITLKKLSALFSVAAMLYLAGCGGGGGAKTSNSFPSKPDTGSITVNMATVSVAKSAARSAGAATIRDYTGYAYKVSASGMTDITGTISGTTFTVTGVKTGRNILVEVYKDKVKLKTYVPEVVAGKTHSKDCDVTTTAAAIVWESLGGSAGKTTTRNVEDLETEAEDATSDVYAVVTALNTALDTAVNTPTSITGSDMLAVTGVTTAVTTASTALSADETAPTIILVTPNNNTIEQDTTETSIVLVFSESMDNTVPTGITVSVEDLTAKTAAVNVTSSAISWATNLRTLTINYGVALNYDSEYQVVVTLDPTKIKDVSGNTLSLASVNGTTVDTTAKTITVKFSTIFQITDWTEATKTIHESDTMGPFDMTFVTNYVDDSGADLGSIVDSGAAYVGSSQCSSCHSSIYTTFVKTNHATAMVRKATGMPDNHFSARCIYCHSVDGPQVPVYTAGSDKPARGDLTKGAWGLAATDYSAYTTDDIIQFATDTANPMASIQCENCHGPASKHVEADHVAGDTVDDIVGPDQAVAASVCAVCHDAPTHHMYVQEWRKTGHAAALDGTHMGGSNSCAPCHSAEGFIALVERQETDSSAVPWDGLTRNGIAGGTDVSFATRNANSNVSCVACHDPHLAADGVKHQLRKPVTELCATCHSGRLKIPGRSNTRGPHHNTQARVLNGYGVINADGKMLWKSAGYLCAAVDTGIAIEATALTQCDTTKDYIETVATTLDKTMGETECVECHMYDGDHTMSPTEEACQACHSGMNAAAVVGGIQSRSSYLISKLQARFDVMKTDAVLVSSRPTAWEAGTATDTAYFQIDWNIKWLQYDGGLGMHNKEMQQVGYEYTDALLTKYGY